MFLLILGLIDLDLQFNFKFQTSYFFQTLRLSCICVVLYIFSEAIASECSPHGTAHILIPMNADKLPPWTVRQSTFISWWDHWGSASHDSAIGTRFYKLLSDLAMLYTLRMSKFCMPTLINHRNNSKAVPVIRWFLPSICIVIWICFVHFSPWNRVNSKQRDFIQGDRKKLNSCRYWCYLINIAVQSMRDRSRI